MQSPDAEEGPFGQRFGYARTSFESRCCSIFFCVASCWPRARPARHESFYRQVQVESVEHRPAAEKCTDRDLADWCVEAFRRCRCCVTCPNPMKQTQTLQIGDHPCLKFDQDCNWLTGSATSPQLSQGLQAYLGSSPQYSLLNKAINKVNATTHFGQAMNFLVSILKCTLCQGTLHRGAQEF